MKREGTDKMGKRYNEELVLEAARLAGCLILENGGETFRAEETVMRICEAGGYAESDVVAIPTGMFVTLADGGLLYKSQVKRIKKRSVDLIIIDRGKYRFAESFFRQNRF